MSDTMREKFEAWTLGEDHGSYQCFKGGYYTAQADARELVGELVPYLQHKFECGMVQYLTRACTCGLDGFNTKAQAFMEATNDKLI